MFLGTRLLQNIPLDIGHPLTLVSIADPYVCVRAANGQVITLALREAKGTPRLAINKNIISSVSGRLLDRFNAILLICHIIYSLRQ